MHIKPLHIAVAAEAILISAGLALAYTMGAEAYKAHGSLHLAAAAAGFPVILAVLELFKIPAGIMLYKARWLLKPLALAMLLAGMVATADTVVSLGSTWFRTIQFEVTAAQNKLITLQDLAAGKGDAESELVIARKEAVEQIEAQLADVSTEDRRTEARDAFGAEWDAQARDNERRAVSPNAAIRAEAEKSQRSMPSRTNYVATRMAEWEATEGLLLEQQSGAANDLRQQLLAANDALAAAQAASTQAVIDTADLKQEIADQKLLISKVASTSLVYDIAAKVYSKPVIEVTEAEANEVQKWLVGSVAFAAAIATGLMALLSTHADDPKPRYTLGQVIRRYVVTRRWRRKQTVEKIVEVPVSQTVYKSVPLMEDIPEFKRSVIADLFGKENSDAA